MDLKTFLMVVVALMLAGGTIALSYSEKKDDFTIKSDDIKCTGSKCYIYTYVCNDGDKTGLDLEFYSPLKPVSIQQYKTFVVEDVSLKEVFSKGLLIDSYNIYSYRNVTDWVEYDRPVIKEAVSMFSKGTVLKNISQQVDIAKTTCGYFRVEINNVLGLVHKYGFNWLDPFINSSNYEAGNLTNGSNTWDVDQNASLTNVSFSVDNKAFSLPLSTSAGAQRLQQTNTSGNVNLPFLDDAGSTYGAYHTITANNTYKLSAVAFQLKRTGTLAGKTLNFSVWSVDGSNKPSGLYGYSNNTLSINDISTGGFAFYNLTFTEGTVNISSGTKYALMIRSSGIGDGSNYIEWQRIAGQWNYGYSADGVTWSSGTSYNLNYATYNFTSGSSTYDVGSNIYESIPLSLGFNAYNFTPVWHFDSYGGDVYVNASCDADNATPHWTNNLTNNTRTNCPYIGDSFIYRITLNGSASFSPLMQNFTASFEEYVPPTTEVFEITAQDSVNSSSLIVFNATINGSSYNTTNGTIYTDIVSGVGNITVWAEYYETSTYLNQDLSIDLLANLTPYNSSYFKPYNLTNVSVGKGSLFVAWNNSVDGHYDYTALYVDGVNQVNTTDTVYNITGLSAETPYNVSVYSVFDWGFYNDSDSETFYTAYNPPPNLTRVYPVNETAFIEENATYDIEVNASDDDGGSLIATWFKNTVQQFQEAIVSGATSVWQWITGYTDSGEYNITVVVNDSYGAESSLYWNVTVDDTYPVPEVPSGFVPDGGDYEYSIPLYCDLGYVPAVSPYHYEFVYGVNGSEANNSLNVNDTDGFYSFDITNYGYGSNFSFGCALWTPAGMSNYTYSGVFFKVNKNNFYLFEPENQFIQKQKPYTLGVVAELENNLNASIAAILSDCNGDGYFDYSFDYRGENATMARETFECINLDGVFEVNIGMVMYKNNSYSWDLLNCRNVNSNDNYCVIYKTYEVVVK